MNKAVNLLQQYISDGQFQKALMECKKLISNNPKETFLTVSYTHLRAHETYTYLVCRLLLEKKFFFNDTATTEIYTTAIVGSVRCV